MTNEASEELEWFKGTYVFHWWLNINLMIKM